VKLVVNRPLLDLLNTVLQTRTGAIERLTDHFERIRTADNRGIAVDYRKSTENNGKRTTDNCEQMGESFDESNGYIAREQQACHLSGYSMSSDSIVQKVRTNYKQTCCMNTDIKEQMKITDNTVFF
jgi:hypothetical protein